ncbi:peptidoglycan DD-metalloendopeptidase family protein [Ferviditalea candida]|uniref:Peptidoglycan DD-metalloendopeptidase family protein n=1 Tax=Ferviditalea candida TaxID=3108399 RepID=A0ABU5ZEF7_9BACL|nr:peptidoglycan DD-metalloendopeptidase family protein [Paenibacillaceae bacterium T2]
MKIRDVQRKITLIFIDDANRPVIQKTFSVSKLKIAAGVSLIALCSFAAAVIFVWLGYESSIRQLHSRLNREQTGMRTLAASKDAKIGQLRNSILSLSEQAQKVNSRLQEIEQLTKTIQEKTGLPSESSAAADPGSDVTGVAEGGPSSALTPENMRQETEILLRQYDSLLQQMEPLNSKLTSLQTVLLHMEQIKRITPSIWPVLTRKITSGFGIRRDPFTGKPSFHDGLDIEARIGDPVFAAADGKVIIVSFDYEHGNYIVIDHGRQMHTMYLHLSKFAVKLGETVQKGDLIARVGTTGQSTGPHLHYQVTVNNKPVNPARYLPK